MPHHPAVPMLPATPACALHISHGWAHSLAAEAFPDLVQRLDDMVATNRITASMIPAVLATAFLWSLAHAGMGSMSAFHAGNPMVAVLSVVGFHPGFTSGSNWLSRVLSA